MVKWKFYPIEDATWEKEDDLRKDCPYLRDEDISGFSRGEGCKIPLTGKIFNKSNACKWPSVQIRYHDYTHFSSSLVMFHCQDQGGI